MCKRVRNHSPCRTRTTSALKLPPRKRRPPSKHSPLIDTRRDQLQASSSPLVEARLVYRGLLTCHPRVPPQNGLILPKIVCEKERKRVVTVLQGVPSEHNHMRSHAQWNTASHPQNACADSPSTESSLCRAVSSNERTDQIQTRCARVGMANRCQNKRDSLSYVTVTQSDLCSAVSRSFLALWKYGGHKITWILNGRLPSKPGNMRSVKRR